MAKTNKDGWIRHRGGKCPLPLGQLVQVRKRDSSIQHITILELDFGHYSVIWRHMPGDEDNDIMAYKLLEGPHRPMS